MRVLVHPDPMLRTVCRADFVIDISTINEMFATMRAANGIGLAAPQVGINARLFVTDWNEVFVNPVIVERWGFSWHYESCLSLPGEEFCIERATRITMSTGVTYEGMQAFVIQHELQHLDGRLICD